MRACQASNEELMRAALEHYDKLSTEACDWLSIIPIAIRYYFVTKELDEQKERRSKK